MVKIAIDAGHGFDTPGKRSPDGEREWSFNNKVAQYAIAKLQTYKDVEILRVDDPTGKTDVPLTKRTDLANKWNADVYASIHHNALNGKWGMHSGIETYTSDNPNASLQSKEIANIVHPRVVMAMGISDRGMKQANFHVLRESAMPAILTEGGFLDSKVDIIKLRDEGYLKAQGEAIADGLAAYFKLKPKNELEDKEPSIAKITTEKFYNPSSQTMIDATIAILKRFEQSGKTTLPPNWREKLSNGTLTESDAIGLLFIVLDQGLFDELK
jgi:N-acetylmuramoyl-L-alanine amidase